MKKIAMSVLVAGGLLASSAFAAASNDHGDICAHSFKNVSDVAHFEYQSDHQFKLDNVQGYAGTILADHHSVRLDDDTDGDITFDLVDLKTQQRCKIDFGTPCAAGDRRVFLDESSISCGLSRNGVDHYLVTFIK